MEVAPVHLQGGEVAIENRPQRTSLVVMVLGDLRQQFSSLGRHRPGGGRVAMEANLAKLGQQETDPGEIGQIGLSDRLGSGVAPEPVRLRAMRRQIRDIDISRPRARAATLASRAATGDTGSVDVAMQGVMSGPPVREAGPPLTPGRG